MTAAHVALLVLGVIAYGGLSVCVAIAVGLTIRGRDRHETPTPAVEEPPERLDVLA